MRKKLLIATTKGLSFRSNLSFEVCYSIYPFKVQRHGWSHAATVPSEAPDNQKGRKRVSRDERRAMVESFVNKYRAENAGKFPKISDATKQVGGSYYVVREIIKELEYKSTTNSSNSVNEIFVEKQFGESKHPTTESVSVSSGNVEIATYNPIQDGAQLVDLDNKETVNTGYEHREEKRKLQTSYGERRLFEEVEIMSTPNDHCIAPGSNIGEKCSKEPYLSSPYMPNDIKTEEAVSIFSALRKIIREELTATLTKYNDHCIASKSNLGEKCSKELYLSSPHMPNDIKTEEAVSSSSDSVTQERSPLKELTATQTKYNDHCIAPGSNRGEKCSKEPYLSSPYMPNDIKTDKTLSFLSALRKSLGEELTATPTKYNDHCIASKSNLGEKCSKELYLSSPHMPNDIKTEEAVPTYSDSVAHQKVEEKCIKKADCERREQPVFVDLRTILREMRHSRWEQPGFEDMNTNREMRHRLQVPNDVKSSEAVSSSSDSVTQERRPLKELTDQISVPFIEKSVSSKSEGQRHDSKFGDMENHSAFEKAEYQKVKEKYIKKADRERRWAADLEDVVSRIRFQVLNNVKSSEAVSSASDSVTQERLPLKEEIDQFSNPFIEKPVSSKSEGQRHDSKFVDMENHSAFEKAEYERKDKEAVDGSNHETEESKRSLELDESKMDSLSRDKNVPIYSAKSTLWGNVKSFANGILNIWKNS